MKREIGFSHFVEDKDAAPCRGCGITIADMQQVSLNIYRNEP